MKSDIQIDEKLLLLLDYIYSNSQIDAIGAILKYYKISPSELRDILSSMPVDRSENIEKQKLIEHIDHILLSSRKNVGARNIKSNVEKKGHKEKRKDGNSSLDEAAEPKAYYKAHGTSHKSGMTKTDLINGMAKDAGITRVAAKKALESFLGNVEASLKRGNRVSVVGFGSFSVAKRTARAGKNPRTGQKISIATKNVVKFKAGSDLSSSVN